MQEQLIIRKAHPTDAARISELIFKVAHRFNAGPSGEMAPWFVASISPAAVAGNIGDPRFMYFVGFVGQAIAGVIALRDVAHVYQLFVASEFHRQGIAANLWAHAKAAAIAMGNRDGFNVRSSEYAVPVYERFGFRMAGARAEKDGVIFVPMKLEP